MPKAKPARKKHRNIRGQGSLFIRGNIYWFELHYGGERFRKSLEVPADGKAYNKQRALDSMAESVNKIRSGEKPKKFDPITVQSMYDFWMIEVERTCKIGTINNYKQKWNSLKPMFGKMFASDITKDKVVSYLSQRKKEGIGDISQNRENRVLQMIFNFNRAKIPADSFPVFPKMHSEASHVRKGRLSPDDYQTVIARLDDPKMFWLKAILIFTFKYGFRKSEMLTAKVSYFDPKKSTFTLPAYSTKNKMEREVTIMRDGEIYKILVKLTAGRHPQEPLFTRKDKAVKDYRGAWKKVTEGIDNGRGKHVTIHDLRRSAITHMSNKGIGADRAGTHLTASVFNRYISRSEEENQATAASIES
jgi:integrase